MALPLAAPAIAAIVATAASYTIPFLVRLVLSTLGMGVITLVGLNTAFDYGQAYVMSMYGGLPADLLNWADYLGAFDALSILFSCMNAALVIKLFVMGSGVGGGSVKRVGFTGGSGGGGSA